MKRLRDRDDICQLLNTDGRVSYMEERNLRLLNAATLTDVVGKAWWDFWPLNQRQKIIDRFKAALAGREQRLALKRATQDGNVEQWVFKLSPVPGFGGKPTSVLVLSDKPGSLA